MRYKSSSLGITALLFLVVFQYGCLKDTITKTYTIYTPVYESKEKVLANIKGAAATEIGTTGKIYLYGNYIFMNEVNKGVHIIDNTNPSSPVNKAFISIPGNIDIAVKGNILYADLYTDLLAIDISNPLQANLVKTVPNIFPERMYGNGFISDTTQYVIDWVKKDTTVIETSAPVNIWNCRACGFALAADASSSGQKNSGAPGMAGSMSRFAIVDNYMYAVNLSTLQSLSIENTANPKLVNSTSVGWSIETIYPFKGNLFIGSSNGMFIYNIANASSPEFKGSVAHFRACDPVVADDDYAYVTLRAGTFCSGTANQLDIVDIKNIQAPKILKSFPMTNPHGLAKDGDYLFICDGKDGLKVYDASTATDIKLLKHLKGMETFDVIAWNKRLILVTASGLEQYDYSTIDGMRLLSKVALH